MRAVMLEVDEALLEERRRKGLDCFDEMWEGALHMEQRHPCPPAPSPGRPRLPDADGWVALTTLTLGCVPSPGALEVQTATGTVEVPGQP